MQVILIRHATAESAGPEGDEARKLTEAGRAEAAATAEALRAMGLKLDLVLTSPLARARETAEIVAQAHGGALVETEAFLGSADKARAGKLRKRLARLATEQVETVGLVGHAPAIDEYVAKLVAGKKRIGTSLSKAGAACIRMGCGQDGPAAELVWLLRREQLALLVRK
jgi:phosphohistidine phosphatase